MKKFASSYWFLAIALTLVVGGLILIGNGISHSSVYQHRCQTTAVEYARECISTPLGSTGLQITDNNAAHFNLLGTPFEITDHNGAPMLYDSISGLYSGGDGNPKDGGNICITDRIWQISSCLYANGDLLLRQTNPDGSQGFTGILTPLDIRFLDCLEQNSLGHCQRITTASLTDYIKHETLANQCTPLIFRHWFIDKRVVAGPGGPSDPTIFVKAGVRMSRGCEILSGRASLYLQFKYKDSDGKYRWRTIRNAVAHVDLKGPIHSMVFLYIPQKNEPNCTGTEGAYRLKMNLSPGTVKFEGVVYHIQPEQHFFPATDNGQKGIFLNCKDLS